MGGSSEEGRFRARDGLNLFYRLYPVKEAKDILVILHGMGEHSGRYVKFFTCLKEEKISIAAFDLRGHGRSEGEEVYVRTFEDYIQDLETFLHFIKERLGPDKRIYLLGHSLGGLIAVDYAVRFPETIQALILSSPALGLPLNPFLRTLNHGLNQCAPHFKYINPVYPPHLTHDPNEIAIYKKDPLIKRKISVRLLAEMLKTMGKLEAVETFSLPFPVSIILAGIERIVDSKKAELFYEKVRAPLKEKKVLPGFFHETFNEIGQAEAFEFLRKAIEVIRDYYQKPRPSWSESALSPPV